MAGSAVSWMWGASRVDAGCRRVPTVRMVPFPGPPAACTAPRDRGTNHLASTSVREDRQNGRVDLFIGTSGWAYPEWKPAFYPADVAQTDFLAYYVTRFTACEVNGTYYRMPSPDTIRRWADTTPPTFRFAIKAPRAMTQGQVRWTDATLRTRDQLLDALSPLGTRLATILLRYPDGAARDDDRLGTILGNWPADAPPLVFDFRDPSWFDAGVIASVADRGHAVCVNETSGAVLDTLPPGRLAYVRLRGEHYGDTERRAWVGTARASAVMRPTYVFGRHKGIPAGDPHAGVGLAEWMVDAVSGGTST